MQDVQFTLKTLVDIINSCDEKTQKDNITVIAENVYYKHCNVYEGVSSGDVFRGRDNIMINGSGHLTRQHTYGTPLYLTINVRNNFSQGVKGLLTIDVRGMVIAHGSALMSMNMIISDKRGIDFAHSDFENSEGVVTNPPYSNYRMGSDDEHIPAHSASGGVFANLKRVIGNGSQETFYVQYFLIFHSGGSVTVDIRCSVDAVLFPIKEF